MCCKVHLTEIQFPCIYWNTETNQRFPQEVQMCVKDFVCAGQRLGVMKEACNVKAVFIVLKQVQLRSDVIFMLADIFFAQISRQYVIASSFSSVNCLLQNF